MHIRIQPPDQIIADLLHRLGDIPAGRVRFQPVPGTATISDLTKPKNRLCELFDDTLVEKAAGVKESFIAAWLIGLLEAFNETRNWGFVAGEGAFMELFPGTVRAPDVAFVCWERLPDRQLPDEPVPALVPDLAIEVLSPSKTPHEMKRKREDYFRAGVRLVWEVDPRQRTIRAYSSLDTFHDLSDASPLTGDLVLPGFTLSLAQFNERLDRHG